MTTKHTRTLGAAAAIAALLASPILFSALSGGGTHGYFEAGRCLCGHDCFIHIRDDGYYQYSPGHGVPEHRSFAIRPHGGEWEILGLPHSEMFWSPLEGEDKVIARFQIRDGALFTAWGNSNNWTRHARVYNPYRIWIGKLKDKYRSLFSAP